MSRPTRTTLTKNVADAATDLRRVEPAATHWSSLSHLLKTGTAKAAYTIPIAAYLILYSDQLSKWLLLDPNSTGPGFLTVAWRAHLLYLGGCALFLSFALFYIFCPWVVRLYQNRATLVSTAISTRDYVILASVLLELAPTYEALNLSEYDQSKLKGQDKHDYGLMTTVTSDFNTQSNNFTLQDGPLDPLIPAHLTLFFSMNDRARPNIRYLIFAIAVVGYLGIAIPALDMFVRVIRKIVGI